jgi:IclR family KDG regulon transcriptional repressor
MRTATSVTKLCRVMEQLQERQPLGIVDLARRTELLPSDVHRILASLRLFGYVEQDPETKKYRLGLSLLRIGLTAFFGNHLCEEAHPILMRLSQKIDAATRIALLDRRELKLFLVDHVKGPNNLSFGVHLGVPERLHSTALGKSVFANLNSDLAFSALKKNGLTRYTRHTVTDPSALAQEFENIRRLGYAVDREEDLEGICCLASPLRNSEGIVVGAISTTMPSSQFIAMDELNLGAHIKAAAQHISAALATSRDSLV